MEPTALFPANTERGDDHQERVRDRTRGVNPGYAAEGLVHLGSATAVC